ncbi:ArnT family glycosyltransferase [Tundrisphaera sp. TA3]|uniref:ArnT family glycosyltransferase n=1 Tax=Tundrisphaera sp. TA3 TaxID=3435775 RepID=UPI003EBA4B9B
MSQEPGAGTSRFVARFEIPIVAVLVVAYVGILWAARGEPGMTWDEPYFFERSRAVSVWLAKLADPAGGWRRAFGPAELAKGWPFCREVPDQHPPVPSLLGMATESVFGPWLGPLRGYRLATVGLFAAAAGVMFRFVRLRWGPALASAAVVALVSDPRPFIDAQLITADSDTGVFWFLAALAHLRACETGRGPWWFGVAAGLAVMCKATGVLLIPAALAWAALYRPRGAWRPLAWAGVTMPATMLMVNPAWWPDPVGGMARWVRAFLSYPQKVPVFYLGRVYDSVHTFLPWHNSAVLIATMVPLGLLALTAVGLIATLRRPKLAGEDGSGRLSDRVVGGWAAIHFLAYPLLRMLPFLPAHDGLRQLVPAFYFLPILAAIGAGVLAASMRRAWIGRIVAAACLATAAAETVRVHPFEMSYYNAAIGGPRGADAAGMETTYFWDSATAEVLGWMNDHIERGATVLIYPPPNVRTFGWEQAWGRLRPDLRMITLEGADAAENLAQMFGPDPHYLIFQNRQGLYMPEEGKAPNLLARLARAPAAYELAPARVDGVRLLAIFDRKSFQAATLAPKVRAQ